MQSSCAQIVATIGPASGTVNILRKMASCFDLARLNFSWGTHKEHENYILALRAVEQETGVHIPIIQDLSGPRKQTSSGHGFDKSQHQTAGNLLTKKDLGDLRFGSNQGVDYVCVSYVGTAGHVEEARRKILEFGGNSKVIAKIERRDAVNNADEIIAVADAVMIGRGDLSQEVPIEQIPFIQKSLTEKCNRARKPVITATELMLSMVTNIHPTRAEVTDVAFAILCGSDAIMLSEETARGAHPVKVLAIMKKIALEADGHVPSSGRHRL